MVIRDHLSDRNTYERLNETQATIAEQHIVNVLKSWRKKYHKNLTRNERKYLDRHLQQNIYPFGVFYATMKVHKTPLKTRPIVSVSGSLLQALATWVDDKLQIAAKAQRSYLESSFDLQKEMHTLTLPPHTFLFTADARSMYTNIPTHRALQFIGRYLRTHQFPGIPVKALMTALHIVMTNNIFTFGDTIYKQRTGTALGTPPAPPGLTSTPLSMKTP